jgi:hypothetical protein
MRGDTSIGTAKIVYGLVGVNSSSPNFTTAFDTDNQFTFTLTGAPQEGDANINFPTNYVFHSAVGAAIGNISGSINGVNLTTPITDGML